MSNADREFEIHSRSWFVVAYCGFCSVGMCIWGIAVAVGAAPGYTFSSVAARVGYSCLFESLAVAFGFVAIRWTTRCRRSFGLVFTDTAIVLPEGTPLGSKKLTSILYADVNRARYTRIGQTRMIKIVFPGGRLPVYSSALRRKEDFDELLSELARRLKPFNSVPSSAGRGLDG